MGLRFVRQSDCPALLDIYARYIETPITFEYELPSRAEFDRRLREFSGFYPYLVWEEQGDILGYAYAHRQFERAAYQWNAEITVYLRPEACGKGLGPRLHRAVLDLLRLQGIKSAYAYIIADNLPSRRMCQAMGYTLAATFPTTGYKAGGWQDMCWYLKLLNGFEPDPRPPVSVHELDPAQVEAVLRSAEAE